MLEEASKQRQAKPSVVLSPGRWERSLPCSFPGRSALEVLLALSFATSLPVWYTHQCQRVFLWGQCPSPLSYSTAHVPEHWILPLTTPFSPLAGQRGDGKVSGGCQSSREEMAKQSSVQVKLKIVVFKEKNWDRELGRPRAPEPMEKVQRCQAEGIFKPPAPCSRCPS